MADNSYYSKFYSDGGGGGLFYNEAFVPGDGIFLSSFFLKLSWKSWYMYLKLSDLNFLEHPAFFLYKLFVPGRDKLLCTFPNIFLAKTI